MTGIIRLVDGGEIKGARKSATDRKGVKSARKLVAGKEKLINPKDFVIVICYKY